MDLTPLFQKLGEGSLIGVICLIVFYIARKDYLANKDELLELYKDVKDDKTILVNLVKENIAGITALTEVVKSLDASRPYIGPDRRRKEG